MMKNPPLNQQQKLQAMGIDSWLLQHPEKLSGYDMPEISLPEECKLLVVSEHLISEGTLTWFEKVLSTLVSEHFSKGLTMAHVLLLPPDSPQHIAEHHLEWVWFAGCDLQTSLLEIDSLDQINQLTTVKIDDIPTDPAQRQSLWQQIQTYVKIDD